MADLFCPLLAYLADTEGAGFDNSRLSLRLQWIPSKEAEAGDLALAESVLSMCDRPSVTSITVSYQIPPPSGVRAVLLPLDAVPAWEISAELQKSGWRGIVAGGPALGSPLFSKLTDPAQVEAVFISPFRWPELAGQEAAFAAAYQELGPHVPTPGPLALGTFVAAQSVLEAVHTLAKEEGIVSRRGLSQRLVPPPRESLYLYRWSETGNLVLLQILPRTTTKIREGSMAQSRPTVRVGMPLLRPAPPENLPTAYAPVEQGIGFNGLRGKGMSPQ
jgi:hypothetical protein